MGAGRKLCLAATYADARVVHVQSDATVWFAVGFVVDVVIAAGAVVVVGAGGQVQSSGHQDCSFSIQRRPTESMTR